MKSLGLLVSCIFVIYLWIAFVVVNCETIINDKPPELEAKWEEAGRDGWFYDEHDFHGGVTFQDDSIVVNSWVTRLLVTCSAHYPVFWDYDISKEFAYSEHSGEDYISVSTYRASEDFNDPSTYIFYSILHINRYASTKGDMGRLVTGNYTCKSAGASINAKNESLSANRFIFWEGTTRHLIYGELSQSENACTKPSCRGKPSRTVTADKDNQTIILPCAVSNPGIRVQLFKKNVDSEEFKSVAQPDNLEIWTGSSDNFITFNPKIGFVLKVQNLPSPYGIYKCLIPKKLGTYGNDEILIVNATSDFPKPVAPYKENLTGRARLYFNPGDRSITCCASGTKPPKIYKKTCETKFQCDKVRVQLENFENFDRTDDRNVNCRSTSLPFDHNSGVFRCFGDGIDIIREYYLPKVTIMSSLEPQLDHPYIYYNENITSLTKDEYYITFSSNTGRVNESTYTGFSMQETSLQCHTSTYLFTHGIRWTVVWRNGTKEFKWITPAYSPLSSADSFNALQLDPHSDMTQVICHAPVSNSWEWVNKTLNLNITKSIPPTLENSTPEEPELITWILGTRNVELHCNISGFPIPEFEWTDPWTDHEYTYRYSDYSWGTIIRNYKTESNKMTFTKVMNEMAGEYTCTGTNFRGSAVKKFKVTVLDEAPSTTTEDAVHYQGSSGEHEHDHEDADDHDQEHSHEHDHDEEQLHEHDHDQEHESQVNATAINPESGWSQSLQTFGPETKPQPEFPSISEDQQITEEDLVKPNETLIHSDVTVVDKDSMISTHSETATVIQTSSSEEVTVLIIALVLTTLICVGLSVGLVFAWLKARKFKNAFNESVGQGTMLNWNEMVGGSRTTVDEDI